MTYSDIRSMPTELQNGCGPRYHESLFRSWHILDKVLDLLQAKVPQPEIIEIILDLKDAPHKKLDRTEIGS